jgi:hypothetical protein
MKVGDLVLWKGDETTTGIILKTNPARVNFLVQFTDAIRPYWYPECDLILISTLDNTVDHGGPRELAL